VAHLKQSLPVACSTDVEVQMRGVACSCVATHKAKHVPH
jgi:hypothetical protein